MQNVKQFSVVRNGITFFLFLVLPLFGVIIHSNKVKAQPFAYVTNELDDTVSVIDTATNDVVDTDSGTPGEQNIPVGDFPQGVAITPDGSRAYVANKGDGTVSVIDTNTNMVDDTVILPALSGPFAVAVTPDGTRLYVTNEFSDTVSVIDTATNSVIADPGGDGTPDITVGTSPQGVAITPDGRRAYVANGGSGTVSVIDTDPSSPGFNTVVDTVTVGSDPFGVAITPDGSRAYVANNGADTVSVIDTATNALADTDGDSNPGPDILAGSGPFWVAITPDAGTVNFASFTIKKARVKLGKKPGTDRFEVWGWFELGTTSDGLDVLDDVLNEEVTVTFDGFEETIPGGSFVRKKKHFEYRGPKKGAISVIKLKDDGKKDGVIEFRVKARGLDWGSIDLINPVFFSLEIGDDLGETDIPFDKKGHFRE